MGTIKIKLWYYLAGEQISIPPRKFLQNSSRGIYAQRGTHGKEHFVINWDFI